ncbi:MAG: transcription antitermination factor NusB [Spirochaetales bacterium]|nr:transcription antitermination factor NusB [Spirochaetales bacterium]
MSSRRKGRILAFQTLFSKDFNDNSIEELVDFKWLDEEKLEHLDNDTIDFAKLLVVGTLQNLDEIDISIKKQLKSWDFNRIVKVELAILRLSVYSLLFQKDIPSTVTINEAIDIAKDYGSNEAYRFINGILDGIKKSKDI